MGSVDTSLVVENNTLKNKIRAVDGTIQPPPLAPSDDDWHNSVSVAYGPSWEEGIDKHVKEYANYMYKKFNLGEYDKSLSQSDPTNKYVNLYGDFVDIWGPKSVPDGAPDGAPDDAPASRRAIWFLTYITDAEKHFLWDAINTFIVGWFPNKNNKYDDYSDQFRQWRHWDYQAHPDIMTPWLRTPEYSWKGVDPRGGNLQIVILTSSKTSFHDALFESQIFKILADGKNLLEPPELVRHRLPVTQGQLRRSRNQETAQMQLDVAEGLSELTRGSFKGW